MHTLNIKKLPEEFSDPDWIQTSDLLLRRQLLYSAELPDQIRAANIKESAIFRGGVLLNSNRIKMETIEKVVLLSYLGMTNVFYI